MTRTPPHSLDAERSVLGAVLRRSERLADLRAVVRPEDFFRDGHQRMWRACLSVVDRGALLTLPALLDALQDDLGAVGGLAYLSRCEDAAALSDAVALADAKIIRGHAHRRAILRQAAVATDQAYDLDCDVDTVVGTAQQVFLDLAQTVAPKGFVAGDRVILDAIDAIEALNEGRSGVTWGFDGLDRRLGPLEPGRLVIVAGRPAAGKTAFLTSMVRGLIARQRTVGICSLEMTREELGMRLLSAEGSVDLMSARRQSLREIDKVRLAQAAEKLAYHGRQFHVEDLAHLTLADIRARSRRLQAEHGMDLLLIDYLALVESDTPSDSRYAEVSRLSRGMKKLAKDLAVPVVCLAQLNRANESRADKRPQLSDLRDSGSIEQDADLVLFIHREAMYAPTPANYEDAEVIVAKARNAPTGVLPFRYIREFTRFDEVA